MMTTYQGASPPNAVAPRKQREAIRPVVDAVCHELGIAAKERKRRAAVEERVMSAWQRGPRQPLDLVTAGLDA